MFNKIALLVLIAALAAGPFVLSPYYVALLIVFFINCILAQSYRQLAMTGDWSLGHVVLMGCGAYGAGMLGKLLGLPFWLMIPVGGLIGALVGAAMVYALIGTRGFGFFIGSFALGEFIRLVWIKFDDPFGGARGIINIPAGEIFGIQLWEQTPFYLLAFVVMLISLWIMFRLDKSRYGRVFEAVYADDGLAESVGISVARYRTMAFVVGAFFAGVAGALEAQYNGAIDPKLFGILNMVYLIIWVVVGGTRTFWGPLIGVAVMTVVFEATRPLEELRPALAGGILVVVLVLLPGGLESIGSKIRNWRRPSDGGEDAPAPSESPSTG